MRTAKIAALVLIVLASLAYVFMHPPRRVDRDFNAFYCAAQTLSWGGDPYRYQPLYACQARHMRPLVANVAVPAPLPPYALAAFEPLAKLPFDRANLAWELLIVGSAIVTAAAVIELTGLSPLLVGACIIPTLFLQSLTNSGLAPVPIALVTAAGVAIVRSRPTAGAVLLGCAMIEPNVALPPALAAFVFVPQMRVRLTLVALAIAVGSLVAGGLELNREYAFAVLPAHAASELGAGIQYSLSSVLSSLGFSDRFSLTAGSVQYALFVLAGLWLAWVLRREIPAVVLAPMALAVSGGTYVHLSQIWGVLPLALSVAARRPTFVAWLGVALLAIPWQLMEAFHASAHVLTVAPVPRSALAEVGWKELADQSRPTRLSWLSHWLTYGGIACTYLAALALAVFESRERRLTNP